MSTQTTQQQEQFANCLRLREIAQQQTLRLADRRDLEAIADLLHSLLVVQHEALVAASQHPAEVSPSS